MRTRLIIILLIASGEDVLSQQTNSKYIIANATDENGKTILLSPSKDDVQFLNYRQTSEGSWGWIALDQENLKIAKLNNKLPYKFIIHGFTSNCSFAELIPMTYVKQKVKANLICVDWGVLANPLIKFQTQAASAAATLLHFPKAVQNTRFVGKTIASFIVSLLNSGNLKDSRDVHLIGHSLGSHVAGVAGHSFHLKKKKKIGRITGLDPAVPLFFPKDFSARLSMNDASFVDVIYTNMAKYGFKSNIAHAIYLPNGGQVQPFCKKGELSHDISELVLGTCSHSMAVDLFAKSIRERIKACSCKSWAHFTLKSSKTGCSTTKASFFGEKAQAKSSGKYCLRIKNLT